MSNICYLLDFSNSLINTSVYRAKL